MADFKSFMAGPAANIPPSASFSETRISQTASQLANANKSVTDAQSAANTAYANSVGAGRGFVNPPNVNPTPADTDSFAHSTGNSPSSTPPPDYKLQFLPNILDNYDVYTYHWKLFITSLEDATSGTVLDENKQTIIAESGVSDLTIDKIEMQAIATPSIEAGTGTQTSVKFEIVEPSGAGLLDKLYYESVALGIGNWLVMPCFLQLEFRGRDPITSESIESGGSSGLGSLRWCWPIKLTNAKANVTNVGTRYEFDAIFYDELAQSNSYYSVQHNITLSNLGKFGDAMQDLEKKLNADQWEKLIDNYSIPDVYKIVVDPVLVNERITISDQFKSTYRGSDFVQLDKKVATFNAGTSIDKIVDALCGSMDYFQRKLQSAKVRNATPDTINEEQSPMKKLWRVVTETKPIAYDSLRQDNAVSITIYIVEYDLGMVDVDAAQTGQTPDTKNAEKKRLYKYVSNKILQKKYNYIFTGLNDQIVSFDLNMNFAFAATLSRFGGIYADSATQEQGPAAQHNTEDEKAVSEQLRKVLQFINDATVKPDQISDVEAAINRSTFSPDVKNRYLNILSYAKNPDRQASAANIVAAGGIGRSGTYTDQEAIKAASLARPISATNANGDNINLKFISDVNIYDPTAQAANATFQTLRKGKLRPIPFRESTQEFNFNSIDPTSDAARARTSSVFATALYSTLDASLQVVKLTVKGDPFWLFPRNIPLGQNFIPRLSIDSIKNSHKQSANVNLYGTDNFIVIRFRTPRIYNLTESPDDPYTEVSTFSGVYKVITITSKFEMGKFTQELHCILDPVIDLQDFLRDIEEASGKPTVIDQPAPAPDIPINSIKTDRILGSANQINGQVATIRDRAGNVVNSAKNTIGTAINSATSNIPVIEFPTPTQAVAQIETAAGFNLT